MAIDTSSDLSQLTVGSTATIAGFTNDFLAEKLLELGVVPGEEVRMEHHAAFGDPLLIAVAGCRISLRKSEAQAVLLVKQ